MLAIRRPGEFIRFSVCHSNVLDPLKVPKFVENTFLEKTVIGMNASAIRRDAETFRNDSDEWRPERWLCNEIQRRKMESSLMMVSSSNTARFDT